MDNDQIARIAAYKQAAQKKKEQDQQQTIKKMIAENSLIKFGKNFWRDSISFVHYRRLKTLLHSDDKPDLFVAVVETKSRLHHQDELDGSLEFLYFLINAQTQKTERFHRIFFEDPQLFLKTPIITEVELHCDDSDRACRLHVTIDKGDTRESISWEITL